MLPSAYVYSLESFRDATLSLKYGTAKCSGIFCTEIELQNLDQALGLTFKTTDISETNEIYLLFLL
jgi:hypothetical protein